MPMYDKQVKVDPAAMAFPHVRMSWKEELASMAAASHDTAYLFILDEKETFLEERRQALEAAKTMGITIRCGQNRSQTPPLDRQFYVVRTA